MHTFKVFCVGLVLLGSTAFAETESERLAREDVERQLKLLVGTPPTKIRVEWVGLDQPQYKIKEAEFTLDGKPLPTPKLSELDSEGDHLIFFGDVTAGNHRVESKVTIENTASQLISTEGGYQWKVGSQVTFDNAAGLEVDVKLTPVLNPAATELKQKFKITSPTQVKMLAKLDDGALPPPPPKAVMVAAVVDAGTADTEVVKPKTAAQKAAELAEAKRKAKEELAAKKKAEDEERKRIADEKRQAQLAAAEEAKAKKLAAAEEAKAKKQAAIDDAKQKAEDAKAAKVAAAEAAKVKVADAEAARVKAEEERVQALELAAKKRLTGAEPQPLEVPDAGPMVVAAAEVDAGAPVADAPPLPKAPEPVAVAPVPAAPPVTETETPWLLYVVPALAGIGLLLFILTRKKKQPPEV